MGYSAKADIWSLGCILIEMFAGRRPWSDEEAIQAMFKVSSVCFDTLRPLNSVLTYFLLVKARRRTSRSSRSTRRHPLSSRRELPQRLPADVSFRPSQTRSRPPADYSPLSLATPTTDPRPISSATTSSSSSTTPGLSPRPISTGELISSRSTKSRC